MRAKRAKNFGGILAVLQGEIVKKGVQNGVPDWPDFFGKIKTMKQELRKFWK